MNLPIFASPPIAPSPVYTSMPPGTVVLSVLASEKTEPISFGPKIWYDGYETEYKTLNYLDEVLPKNGLLAAKVHQILVEYDREALVQSVRQSYDSPLLNKLRSWCEAGKSHTPPQPRLQFSEPVVLALGVMTVFPETKDLSEIESLVPCSPVYFAPICMGPDCNLYLPPPVR